MFGEKDSSVRPHIGLNTLLEVVSKTMEEFTKFGTEIINLMQKLVNFGKDSHLSSSLNGHELMPCVTMPMFTVKDDFTSWENRFKIYCDMYYMNEETKRIHLLFLMDNEVAYSLHVNQLFCAEYKVICNFLRVNYSRHNQSNDAILELDCLTSKKIETIESLELVAQKINDLVEIGYLKSSFDRRREIKIARLFNMLPDSIDCNNLNSNLPTFDRAKCLAKILWYEYLRQESCMYKKAFENNLNCSKRNEGQDCEVNSRIDKCHYCKEYGHTKYFCPRKSKGFKTCNEKMPHSDFTRTI
uniref:CCHC-type domain-containing protein n=1 Tax=Strongyloides papillosus TaxID=174720 RepID=A0A0N5B4L7_STREA